MHEILAISYRLTWWWLGGAMVLEELPVPGRPTIWVTVGRGPNALAVGAGGGCLDIFTLSYPFFLLSLSLWETAQYRLKYCLKWPLNPKPTNQQPLYWSNAYREPPPAPPPPPPNTHKYLFMSEQNGSLAMDKQHCHRNM